MLVGHVRRCPIVAPGTPGAWRRQGVLQRPGNQRTPISQMRPWWAGNDRGRLRDKAPLQKGKPASTALFPTGRARQVVAPMPGQPCLSLSFQERWSLHASFASAPTAVLDRFDSETRWPSPKAAIGAAIRSGAALPNVSPEPPSDSRRKRLTVPWSSSPRVAKSLAEAATSSTWADSSCAVADTSSTVVNLLPICRPRRPWPAGKPPGPGGHAPSHAAHPCPWYRLR